MYVSQKGQVKIMKRQEIILRAISGQLKWYQAAQILGISDRQMRRIKERYEKRGYTGLYDRRTRIPSDKRIPMKTVKRVLSLYRDLSRLQEEPYNVSHFYDILKDEHKIATFSYSWLKNCLQGAGLVTKGKKKTKHRMERERRPARGMMLIQDTSEHAWLSLIPDFICYLILVVDDATSEPLWAELFESDGTIENMRVLREVIHRHGLFSELYTDRATHFTNNEYPGQNTQIEDALKRLNITHIKANSPQAKGRIERPFQTMQDRLIKDLRRHGINNINKANMYIKRHWLPFARKRWGKPPLDPKDAFIPYVGKDLDYIFAIYHERTVTASNTISFKNLTLQIKPNDYRYSYAKCRVAVLEHIDGSLSITYGNQVVGKYDLKGIPLPYMKAAA